MRNEIVAVAVAAMVTGCATSPGKIKSTYVSPIEYSHLDCDQLQRELVRVNRRLSEVAGSQKKESTKDAVALGVGLVVFWPALFFMLGDDQKEEISRLKGQYEALETAAIEKKCGYVEELEKAKAERDKMEKEYEAKRKDPTQNRGQD